MKVKLNLIQNHWLWFEMHGTYMDESSSTAEYEQQQQTNAIILHNIIL